VGGKLFLWMCVGMQARPLCSIRLDVTACGGEHEFWRGGECGGECWQRGRCGCGHGHGEVGVGMGLGVGMERWV
jgi:hypothetical protein